MASVRRLRRNWCPPVSAFSCPRRQQHPQATQSHNHRTTERRTVGLEEMSKAGQPALSVVLGPAACASRGAQGGGMQSLRPHLGPAESESAC